MNAKVIPFPTVRPCAAKPPGGVPYPKQLQVVCDTLDGIAIDPGDKSFFSFQVAGDLAGEPRVYAVGDEVVLDLGDCLPDHTTVHLDPKAAYEWARALIYAARAAKENSTP